MKAKTSNLLASMIVSGASVIAFAGQWEIPSQGIQELQVRAKAAKILVQRSNSAQVRIQVTGARENQWTQENINGLIKMVGPEQGNPEDSQLSIELPVSPMQTKMVFEDVVADVQGVSRLTLTTLRGRIVARGTGDSVRFFSQKAEIQAFQNMGVLEVESFGGKILISEGQNTIKLKMFNGDIVLDKNIGGLQLESQSSNAKISGQQGIINLQWGKGNLSLTDFSGRVEGSSVEGNLQIQMKADSMVDLQAQRGRINITMPSDSGASLNIRSATGEVAVPGPIKPSREGRFRVARGKLVGSVKGSVSVRAEDASIVVR